MSRLGYTPVFLMTAGLYFLSVVLMWWRFAGERFGAPSASVEVLEDGQRGDEETKTSDESLVSSDSKRGDAR